MSLNFFVDSQVLQDSWSNQNLERVGIANPVCPESTWSVLESTSPPMNTRLGGATNVSLESWPVPRHKIHPQRVKREVSWARHLIVTFAIDRSPDPNSTRHRMHNFQFHVHLHFHFQFPMSLVSLFDISAFVARVWCCTCPSLSLTSWPLVCLTTQFSYKLTYSLVGIRNTL